MLKLRSLPIFPPIFFLAVLAPLVLLAGCSSGPDVAAGSSFVAMAPAPLPASAKVAEYHLSPGDLIDITVFQVPDLTKEVQVDADGRITLPLIGELSVTGKTTHDLETEIATKLGTKYLQSPQVSVFLKAAAGRQVTITGAVSKPGVYPIVGQLTLVQALAELGDINAVGDPSAVLVFRQGNGSRMVAKFNVDDIRAGKAADPDLYAGDMIVVDTSGIRSAWQTVKEALPAAGFVTTTAVSTGAL